MTNRRNIPFSPPDVGEEEIALVAEALRSGWITTGPKTKELERQVAAFCNTNRAVCLGSATACMENTLILLGVGPGDEVIVPAYTYTATASVVCHVGATVKFVDTQADSREMDYEQMEQAITEKTKVIIPVDLAGIICDYDKVYAAVERKKHLFHASDNELQKAFGRVVVMSDAAHAFGSMQNGKMCGEIADFTSFSFHAVKNFTTAEGGAITWKDIEGIDNESIYKQYMLLSLHGQSKDALAKTQAGAWEYDIVAPLYKCNMTDIMAAIGLAQMSRYKSILSHRREIIETYDKYLKGMPNIEVTDHFNAKQTSNGHLYIVRFLDKGEEYRNDMITKMAERGIACNVHFKPLPMMTAYKALGYDIKDFPNAYNMYKNAMTLPTHTRMSDEDVEYVITNFVDLIKNS